MTRRRISIVLAALLAAAGVGVIVALSGAVRAAKESPQRAVMVEAERLLEAYYQEHGRYPDSLDELTFKFGGDGDASRLALLEYKSDGAYYRIVTKSVWDGSELTVCH